MSTISSINNHFPILDRINRMTTHLINDKDTNGDGVLDQEELGVSEERFDKIDKNDDGKVDRKELNMANPLNPHRINIMTTHLINEKDTNGDGVLDQEELGVSEERFDKIDKNDDGKADRKELNMANPLLRLHRITTQFIRKKDTDGDMVLDQEEFGVSEEKFDKIDTNDDGKVDRKELKAAYMAAARLYSDNDIEESKNTDVSV